MNREERKKQKEITKKIKGINNSLTYVTKEMQKELDVLAVQKDEHVYFCGNNIYKKIYMFHPASLGNKRVAFIKALTDRYNNRIRFSICTKNKNGKVSAYMFMTVSFEGENYYEVRQVITEFENSLMKNICAFLGIKVDACNLENALTYIHMNYSGEMKKINPDILFGKGKAVKLFKEIDKCSCGRFECLNRYGVSYIGKNYLNNTDGINYFMQEHEGTYFIVVDFQGFSEEEQLVYDLDMRNKYNLHNETEKPHFINMTYVFTSLLDDEKKVDSFTDDLMRFYDSKGVLIMPAVEQEKITFISSCSLGLVDYRSMQNASEELIGGLLL